MVRNEADGLLNGGGETINLQESSPEGSIHKEPVGVMYESDEVWYVKLWRRDKLMIFIVIAVILGFMVGLLCNDSIQALEEPTRSTLLTFLGFPGEILMRMLKMLILPLIVSSLIVGLAELDQKASGKLGKRAVLYYMSTTLFAVVVGIILVIAINPGSAATVKRGKSTREVRAMDSMLDLVRNMFPDNLVKATISQMTTGVKKLEVGHKNHTVDWSLLDANQTAAMYDMHDIKYAMINGTNVTYYTTFRTVRIAGDSVYGSGTNILGLVVFSLSVGLLLGRMGRKARVFIDWMVTLNDLVMELVTIVMWYSPIGIWSLIAAKFGSMNNISGVFESLGLYMTTVICGLIVHSFIVLPGMYFLVTRKNPITFIKGIVQALLTAFGTSSSSATLPVTFRCLEENNGIDKRVTRFVLPVGATINMDGTALYEAVAAIFIAQAAGLDLNFGQYIAVSLTATLASIGAAGIPQAGLVTMLIVLQTIGLPEDAITLIVAVDWFLDRIRTTVNVLGDAFGAGIVHHLSTQDLLEMDCRTVHESGHGEDGLSKLEAGNGAPTLTAYTPAKDSVL